MPVFEARNDRREGSAGVARVAVTLPALAALTVGALYGVGSLVRAAQIHDAGVSVRDGLPLVPLEAILATGLAVIFANFLLVGVWILSLGGLAWSAREQQRMRTSALDRVQTRQAAVVADLDGIGKRSDEILNELKELATLVEVPVEGLASDRDVVPEERERQLAELRAKADELRAYAKKMQSLQTEAEEMKKESQSLREQLEDLRADLERLETKRITVRGWAVRIALLLLLVLVQQRRSRLRGCSRSSRRLSCGFGLTRTSLRLSSSSSPRRFSSRST